MSVDGIGKGGGAPEIGGTGEATSVSDAESVEPATEGVSSEFSLEAAASAQGPNDVAAASDLQRLEQGQITLEQYLDGQVENAVSHLVDKLQPAQLDELRSQLREELRVDPVLVELVRRATA
ncbi:MAG: hypothetical protein HRU17_22645 [Polyangiaceae bacterium]|nr:hypothetical protein [Polyangiaceae bacterium]